MTVPGEFTSHQRTLICWPTRGDLYGRYMGEAKRAHVALARTVSGFKPVTMIASPGDVEEARRACGDGVEVVDIVIDDSWVRDSGPIYAVESDQLIAQDWIFNGWGNKFTPYDNDARLAERWARVAGHQSRAIDMVLEGGSITVDGTTAVTTEQCLLNPNRNPDLDRGAIESRLCSELGVGRVVWLPHGLSMDVDTDGHVDNVASFVAPGVLVVQGCADDSQIDHQQLALNRSIAEQSGLVVHEIPVLPTIEWGGRLVQVPYLNFYLVNGGVIVPVCGHADDDEMLALLAEFIPDRQVVGLDVGGVLAYGGGGIHCVTQQIPAV